MATIRTTYENSHRAADDQIYKPGVLEASLYEALGQTETCKDCGKVLDTSTVFRHKEYGCAVWERVGELQLAGTPK